MSIIKKPAVQAAADAFAWLPAMAAAVLLRYDFHAQDVQWFHALLLTLLLIELQIGVGRWRGLYSGEARYGTFDELGPLSITVTVATGVGFLANVWWLERLTPASAPLIAGFVATAIMFAVRYVARLTFERSLRPDDETAEPVLIFGAGEGGDQLITTMVRNPSSPYLPVGILDDDPKRAMLRLRGVPVLGRRDAMASAAQKTGARMLVIAIPSAPASLVRELTMLAAEAKLEVRILPSVRELLGVEVTVADVRRVTEADLLGRHEVDTDMASVAGYLTDRVVLVTGAGGSIGSELCRQISRFQPSQLVMLDRDESALHALQLSLEGRALLDTETLVVADIRDPARLHDVFARFQPDVVFHAAALKHLPLLEMHPSEAWKTNVIGTQSVLDAAAAVGASRFVNISTDKAADPISVLGYSKRIGERLTAFAATKADGVYLSVRFGNVLGSRGSVLTAFQQQIETGGPVTVTDPDVTRFFMTIEEACQLVVQAGAIGRSGEALVLDMGEPVRIADFAKRLIDASGRPDIAVEYTGLRPGEKLHEDLFGTGESDDRPFHQLVAHTTVPPLDPDALSDPDAMRSLAGATPRPPLPQP